MPSSRRMKITGLIALLTVLIIFYVSNGAKNTYDSPFYTRTVEAIKNRQDAEARQDIIAEEKTRLARVEKIQEEHDAAVSAAVSDESIPVNVGGDAAKAAGAGTGKEKQKPLVEDLGEVAESAKAKAGTATDKVLEDADNVKPVAGRKTMSKGEKVVPTKPATASDDDGVAKVGNVAAKASNPIQEKPGPESEEDHAVETELNDILKKGPIIIFSKSFCPFSKKAKHILLDMYNITPAPYVVELDQHELGPGLQATLQKSTGRRTVPNVLINGKSIGGGDDIAALHQEGKLIETVTSMAGKRVMSMVQNEPQDAAAKAEVKFKA
ncbi:hypothetical protein KC318_g6271 [Hortaea werneckii]|uniref:Glutaredoxin domain-containing protein n=1 Tax=Hortaea werneckii TaxID=91943 RepID=A0A3M6YHH5_HORWE|nr:hypothetical protein KC334_g6471 [Hortaea werneckii]KAI6960338.1 hypothetical protein KC355_g12743 [Hortaea werneckii]KAI7666819.1 hypothetical protein KC318_g6271 [Hortaea werneckii]RMY02516.1 hypothetical protein D0867_11020 [Hortaea werneckii]RMY21721.1 hypothetical protein D0866_12168 [Hortaea werneckii]